MAVEIDRDLEPILRERLEPFGDRANLYFGDILASKRTINQEVLALLDEAMHAAASKIKDNDQPVTPQPVAPQPAEQTFKLIANLPYNIASPLLIDLALDHPRMSLGVVMVQREVADRLAAAPGSKAYGPLSVLVQAMCEVKRVATLPASCFWPPPKVASAVVRLERRAQPMTDDPHRLAALVQRLFQQRRKQLGSILGREVAFPVGVEARDRPEQLSVSQLAELARQFG